MGYLKEQNIIYVDNIQNKLEDEEEANLQYCPKNSMRFSARSLILNDEYDNQVNYGKRYFEFNDISNIIGASDISNIPMCSTSSGFSGCCKRQMILENSANILDECRINSTGLVYKNGDNYYNICHKELIQDKVNILNSIYELEDGLEKFFIVLLATIVLIVFYTLFSLPYEFWLRYGNSIQCIYYKVKSTCTNMVSNNNDKLTIIEYIFPNNLHKFPYETCNANDQSGGMKGGEKEGAINSNYINYIEYNENGSKCINVDFDDDDDDRNSRYFPYNLGEYANDESKVKNPFIIMILKGFSFYFLYTILFIRTGLNYLLSSLSKRYQKIYEKKSYISSILLLINFIFTPFLLISALCGLITIALILPIVITIMDIFKNLNYFNESIKTSPSTKEKPNYYDIYSYKNIFYNLLPNDFDTNDDKSNKLLGIVVGLLLTFSISAIIYAFINSDGTLSEEERGGWTITTLTLLIILPFSFFQLFKHITMPETGKKTLTFLKHLLLDIFLMVPFIATVFITFIVGNIANILAVLYSIFNLLFNFYYIPFSNSIEFLDLMKSHSKLITIILLICVITSSATANLGQLVTGILGGLLGLYLLYELYKLSKQ
jgi:hypothetical protein